MSATITLSGDWLQSVGNVHETSGTGNAGVYATGGVTITPQQLGLGTVYSLIVSPASGYTFKYTPSTAKLKVYAGDGGVAAHAHDLVIIGAQAGATTNITARYATEIFGKEAVTDATIAGSASATKGGISSAVSNTGVEIGNAVDLSSVTFNWRAEGL